MRIREGKTDTVELTVLDVQGVEPGAMGVKTQFVEWCLPYHDSADDVAASVGRHHLCRIGETAPQKQLIVRLDVHRINRDDGNRLRPRENGAADEARNTI